MTNHSLHSTKVPKHMLSIYQQVVSITDPFCQNHLNEEYGDLVHYATAALARKRPSPLERGQMNTWACAIVYAIGAVNFLFDKNTQPFMSANDLTQAFQVSPSTATNKSRQVRQSLKMHQFDHRWIRPSQLTHISGVWFIMMNGFYVDIRNMPRDVQEIAYKKGLIPYIYADNHTETHL